MTAIYLFITLFLQDGLQWRARQFDLIVGLCLMASCDEPTRLLPKPSRRESKAFSLPKKPFNANLGPSFQVKMPSGFC